MPPGEFAVGKFTSPKAINSKLPCGNCDFAFRAKSPGGILCRPYTEGNLKFMTLPIGGAFPEAGRFPDSELPR